MSILFKNIQELIQVRSKGLRRVEGVEMQDLPTLKNAFLWVEEERIKSFGPMAKCPALSGVEEVDASGRLLLPSWCDSHTHLVYAGHRESEFVDGIYGLSYEKIAAKGGGILSSMRALRAASEAELFHQSSNRMMEVMKMGTGAIEIKSGYGLDLESELKMLRVIQKLKENFGIPIKSTFLCAHALPPEYKDNKEAYVELVGKKMIPQVAKEGLADFMDVFCEKGYFSIEDTAYLIEVGRAHGLQAKIHVNQFNAIGGVKIAVEGGALSVDHLEVMQEEDITVLNGKNTMPVALPNCSFYLKIPYTPARKIIDSGLSIALATDYNPGSAPSGNMNLVVSLACIQMKMTPEEAINAATINGAYAMGLEEVVGSITEGKLANLILTKPVPSYAFLPYSFGENWIEEVYVKGNKVTKT